MGDDELIDKWLSNTPPDDSVDKVERILIKVFGEGSVKKRSGGSHQYRVKHPSLEGLPGFGTGGHLSIPVKNGTRVKGYYLKRIAQAIKRLEEVGLI
ncbi:MAG: type II toxin-antitoxin system HicA family toxin [Armatimonadota bacterium]